MAVKVKDVADVIEEWAPRSYAIPEDNPGLQVGDPSAEVRTVLVAVDATPRVVDEAMRLRAEMLVTHHPLLFTPLRSINTGCGQGALIGRILQAGIAVYSAHTNLDVAEGGVEDLLARAVGLAAPGTTAPRVLDRSGEDGLLKLVVFVPRGYEEKVRQAMCDAGAGWIGKYSDCSFMTAGTGTFKALEGARPFLGEVGSVERADELRLETVIQESAKAGVLRAMLGAHPYEEVAFDIYPLRNQGVALGFGRVGDLARPTTLGELAERVRSALGAPYVRVYGEPSSPISRVATSAGSGGGNAAAAAAEGAQVLITADVKHTQALAAMALGISVIEVGHLSSERPIVRALVERLNARLGSSGAFSARASEAERELFAVFPGTSDGRAAVRRASRDFAGARLTAYIDGGSRGNPGPAAYAVVLLDDDGNTVLEAGRSLDRATNNAAEYHALILAARAARELGARKLSVRTDSELVERQLLGRYRVKSPELARLHEEARELLGGLDSWEVVRVSREENRRADALVNRVLDGGEDIG
ncbi:MAG: Nif3-like dinuclear metal center hexameric protein [Firmicutes bacterium]|jgi:dinuclear metal center YbgI/SA1388 family protein|nr:Nif3-like dinuclear metal center hexameric protein [Bacillota bacterium]